MALTYGVAALARPTFDVPYAEQMAAKAYSALRREGIDVVGPRALLFDRDAAMSALAEIKKAGPVDLLLILQVTFTDAAATVELAEQADLPLGIWALPEPRRGGRLRLNAFCGLNLASHALGLRSIFHTYLYQSPESEDIGPGLKALADTNRLTRPLLPSPSEFYQSQEGDVIVNSLQGNWIGVVGNHPDGFDTCRYNAATLDALAGVHVERFSLNALFDTARAVEPRRVEAVRARAEAALDDLESVDQEELDRSLRLKCALDDLRERRRLSAFAIRCWPETFTEYGGAVCGPVSMMGEDRIPCACEADVFGALTSMIMQRVADEPPFLVDLVDLDAEDDTGVVWHCGQAPISMADPETAPTATIHTNRKMPLLYQFALKPGRVTFARVSQARGTLSLVLAGGEMLQRPMAFTGTSGVVRFDAPAQTVLSRIMNSGLEHHVALAYGDHRDTLRSVAAGLGLPLVELT